MAERYFKFVHSILALKEWHRFRSSIPITTQCCTGAHTATIFFASTSQLLFLHVVSLCTLNQMVWVIT